MTSSEPRARSSLLGRVLGGSYRIVRDLEGGGMGELFEAEHTRLGCRLAVKVLAEHLSSDETALARFHNEARALASLEHPHIVRILDFDLDGDKPYFVMELLAGETLSARLERLGRLSPRDAVIVAEQVASALDAAHRLGIIHRDLKPDNVFLVDVAGEPLFAKLLDFGASRFTRGPARRLTLHNQIIGTPEYMAPEQATGQPNIDESTDQHALALIVFQMLTGISPFEADQPIQSLRRVILEEPPLATNLEPSVPSCVADALKRALAKDPAERYSDVRTFVSALGAGFSSRRAFDASEEPTVSVDTIKRLLTALERIRDSYEQGDVVGAAELARSVFDFAEQSVEPRTKFLFDLSRPLLTEVFRARLQPMDRLIVPDAGVSPELARSPAVAFVLSCLEDWMTLDDVADVGSSCGLAVLRLLLDFDERGLIRPPRNSEMRSKSATSSKWKTG